MVRSPFKEPYGWFPGKIVEQISRFLFLDVHGRNTTVHKNPIRKAK